MPTPTPSPAAAIDPKVFYRPVLQNKSSPYKTAATLRIDLHYAKLGIIARWDWRRYARLAQFLNLTIYELGSTICLPHATVENAKNRNKFDGPVCLLLTLLEAQAMMTYTNDVIRNPFPHDPSQGS